MVATGYAWSAIWRAQRQNVANGSEKSIKITVPWFIVWFVVASLVRTYLPNSFVNAAHWIAPLMITVALTAIGLQTDLAKMKTTGVRPIILGWLIWISVAGTSLLVQYFTHRW